MFSCRGCGVALEATFLDLGISPIANNFLRHEDMDDQEIFYPLHVRVCLVCSMVQLPEILQRENLFVSSYIYHSSFSKSWLEHSREYVRQINSKLKLKSDDLVIEIASNDGYLLQYFKELGVEVLGVEPSREVADESIKRQIPTVVDFFGEDLAIRLAQEKKPRLVVANNVLAHVPNLHDFIKGLSILIADDGIITLEFPHINSLIKNTQFDTIYHEHYSYLSLNSITQIFEKYRLSIFDVESLQTHGGSLRIYVSKSNLNFQLSPSVERIMKEESLIDPRETWVREMLQKRVSDVKFELLQELLSCKQQGLKVAAYGAAAKGNTLINYVGIRQDLISFVVDVNPNKQNKLLPGSRIPVYDVDFLFENTPDVLLVLPWNLFEEIDEQLNVLTKTRGMKLLRAIPKLKYS